MSDFAEPAPYSQSIKEPFYSSDRQRALESRMALCLLRSAFPEKGPVRATRSETRKLKISAKLHAPQGHLFVQHARTFEPTLLAHQLRLALNRIDAHSTGRRPCPRLCRLSSSRVVLAHGKATRPLCTTPHLQVFPAWQPFQWAEDCKYPFMRPHIQVA